MQRPPVDPGRVLRDRKAGFRDTFEQAAVGLAHVAPDGRFLWVNKRLCAITGYSRNELSTKTFQEITHPDDLDIDLLRMQNLLDGRIQTYAIDKRYRRKNGAYVWISLTVSLIRDENDEPVHFISVIEEIDARKQAELALRESQTRLRLALDTAQLGSWDIDLRTDSFLCSDQYRSIMGLPKDVALTRSDARARFHPDDLANVMAEFDRAVTDNSAYTTEFRVFSPDGGVHWVSSTGRPIYENGKPVRVVGVALDITQRRDHDARQRFLVHLYERLTQPMAPDALRHAVCHELLEFFAFSRVIYAAIDPATGYAVVREDVSLPSPDRRGPFPVAQLITGELHDELRQGRAVSVRAVTVDPRTAAVAEALAQSGVHAFIAIPLRTEGALGGVLIAADTFPRAWRPDKVELLKSAAEHLWLALENRRLYGEAMNALGALTESESRFRRMFEANLFGMFFWRDDGLILDANDAFLEMVDRRREHVDTGMLDWIVMTPPDWTEANARAIAEIAETGACAPFEKEYFLPDGSTVPVLVAAAVFPGRDEGVAIVIDLSDRRAQERFEQEFLAGIAHDLKNPLAAMKAQAQLMHRRLRTGRLSEQIAGDGLRAIEINVNRVTRRIEELMDIALLRSGRTLDLVREPVDLEQVVQQRVETYRQTTDRHHLALAPAGQPLVGQWDANRIERAIDNLLSNAIKYSPSGGEIAVALTVETNEQTVWAVVSVSDHGVGIPAADLPHVFTQFRRGSNVQGRVRGSGLGLAGVKLLVEQHGGSITAASAEGEGSTFVLRLPVEPLVVSR